MPDGVAALEHLQALKQMKDRLAALRQQQALCANARFSMAEALGLAILIGLVGGVLWAIVSVSVLDSDPWLGKHSELMCPTVCEGCEGPYVWHSWNSRNGRGNGSSHSVVYCRAPGLQLETMDWMTKMEKRFEHEPYEASITSIGLSSIAVWFVLGVPLGLLSSWRKAEGLRQLVPRLAQEVAALEEALRGAR